MVITLIKGYLIINEFMLSFNNLELYLTDESTIIIPPKKL